MTMKNNETPILSVEDLSVEFRTKKGTAKVLYEADCLKIYEMAKH